MNMHSMPDGIRRHLIQRWSEPLDHEPATAYFSRLAGMNLQTSARVFAQEMGFDGRALEPGECLEAVRHLPIDGRDALVHATPVVTARTVRLLGATVRRKHWSGDHPRYCPGCIADSPHYRTYHGLWAFTVCPFHGCDIDTGRGGEASVSWLHPTLSQTPNGTKVGQTMPRRHQPLRNFERWMLGQLGVVEPWSVPLLEGVPLRLAIDTVELLGRADLRGWSRYAPRIGTHGMPRKEVVARGFAILQQGPQAIETLFERIATEAGDRKGPKGRAWGLNQIYGWLFNAVLYGQRTAQNLEAVKTAAMTVAKRRGAFARSTTSLDRHDADIAYLHRAEVAEILGIQPRLVDPMAKRLNIRADVQAHRFVMYARSDVDLMTKTLTASLDRAGAAQHLGLTKRDFGQMQKAGVVAPFCRLGGSTNQHDRFHRLELDALIAKPKLDVPNEARDRYRDFADLGQATGLSTGEIAVMVGTGQLLPAGRGPDNLGFQSLLFENNDVDRLKTAKLQTLEGGRERQMARSEDLALCDAAAALGVETSTMQALVGQGYVAFAEARLDGARDRIDRKSLDAFVNVYAPAADYAEALGCSRKSVTRRLRALGVKTHVRPTSGGGGIHAFVMRTDVLRVLGVSKDPLVGIEDGWTPFWHAFGEHLTRRKSVFRLVRSTHEPRARLLSGDRRSSCIIEVALKSGSQNRQVNRAFGEERPARTYWSDIHRRIEILAYDQRTTNPLRSADRFERDHYEINLTVLSQTHRLQRQNII